MMGIPHRLAPGIPIGVPGKPHPERQPASQQQLGNKEADGRHSPHLYPKNRATGQLNPDSRGELISSPFSRVAINTSLAFSRR